VCITINQPDTKPNPNPNPNATTKQHAVVSIQLNIVTCPTYPEGFIIYNVIAPFLLLSVVIVLQPCTTVSRIAGISYAKETVSIILSCFAEDVLRGLRSATRRLLVVPRCRLSTLGPRAFSVAGPSFWNSLPDHLRDPDLGRDSLRHLLKTQLCTLF